MKHSALRELTTRALPAGKYADGQGLWLVKRRKAHGKWILRFELYGNRREMGLGRWPDVGISEARGRAEEARRIVRDGTDPIYERLKAKRAGKPLTLKEAVDGCFEARKAELKAEGEAGRWMSPLASKADIDTKLSALDQELRAIAAYENVKTGRTTPGTKSRAPGGIRRPGQRAAVLAVIKEAANGISPSDVLTKMSATSDADKTSVRNALSALKRNGLARYAFQHRRHPQISKPGRQHGLDPAPPPPYFLPYKK